LFTASTEVIDSLNAKAQCPITVIGEIVADKASKVTLVDSKGKPVSIPKKGWEHFIAK